MQREARAFAGRARIGAGTVMSPQVAFYTLQGCKTLSLRIERQSENAMAIARHLEFEHAGMREYIAEMSGHSPYRASEPT